MSIAAPSHRYVLRMFLKIKLLLFLIFLCASLDPHAQNFNNYKVEIVSQDDGLSQGSNYFRFEDSRGFMWLTGNDALNRYDGSSIKVYNLDRYFKTCPRLLQGYGFAEDGKNLYVGSTRGLYKYDYDLDAFTLIDLYHNFSNNKTAMPFGFANGKIWCFNEEWKIVSYEVKTRKVKLEFEVPLPQINSVHVYNMEDDYFYNRMPFFVRDGSICFIGKENIVVYNFTSKTFRFPFGVNGNGTKFLSAAYHKKRDKVFLGTIGDGIIVFEQDFQHHNQYERGKTVSSMTLYNDYVFSKLEENENRRIVVFDNQFRLITYFDKYPTGNFFGFDKAGRFWFCEDGLGQVVLNFNGSLIKNSAYLSKGRLSFPTGVGYFAELPENKVIVQSQIIFDTKTENFEPLQLNWDKIFYRIFADPFKNEILTIRYNWWDTDKKLFSFDARFRPLQQFSTSVGEFGRLQHVQFFKKQAPLLSFSNGLFWLNRADRKLESVPELPNKNPFYISQLSKNRLAISYIDGDMLLVQLNEDRKFSFLRKVLPGVQSFYMQEDTLNQCYWVGTNEGIYVLDRTFQVKKKIDINNGLAGSNIYGILLDDYGKLWCSHQRGLSAIDTKSLQIINFDKEDGIQDWDFNNRSFLKASNGTLFFGGMKDFNYIKPPIQFKEVYKPEIYIDEVTINNNLYEPEAGINKIKAIRVSNNENNIVIKALIKDLQYSKQRVLLYRIRNRDAAWIKVAVKNNINFTSLAPGNYTIELGYNDKFNQKIVYQKTIEIIVENPFYQTIWFWAIMAALFSGLFIFIVGKVKFAKQQRKYREHLALENQRNKITADLHDDIGATLSNLQINSAIANEYIKKQKPEAAQKVLLNIEKQTRKLSENMGDIVWSLKPNKEALMQLSTRVRNTAIEILGSIEMEYNIQIDERIDTEILDYTMKKNIILIIKEALNNAAKYSQASLVSIKIEADRDGYLIAISDNGKGFDPLNSGGNGIGNMKRRTEEMNGLFDISGEGGTCLKIRVPKFRG